MANVLMLASWALEVAGCGGTSRSRPHFSTEAIRP